MRGGEGGVLCKHMLKGFLAVSQATPLQLERIEGSSYIASINVLFVGLHPTMLQRVKGCLHLSALQHQNETKKPSCCKPRVPGLSSQQPDNHQLSESSSVASFPGSRAWGAWE